MQFQGHEGDFTKLTEMAQGMLGTGMQRDLLIAYVKQRLGM